jgi:hypothetical protein
MEDGGGRMEDGGLKMEDGGRRGLPFSGSHRVQSSSIAQTVGGHLRCSRARLSPATRSYPCEPRPLTGEQMC